jgi:hypothetical protein
MLFRRHGLHTSDKGDVKGRESTEVEAINSAATMKRGWSQKSEGNILYLYKIQTILTLEYELRRINLVNERMAMFAKSIE